MGEHVSLGTIPGDRVHRYNRNRGKYADGIFFPSPAAAEGGLLGFAEQTG
jgi:hypothetical protein